MIKSKQQKVKICIFITCFVFICPIILFSQNLENKNAFSTGYTAINSSAYRWDFSYERTYHLEKIGTFNVGLTTGPLVYLESLIAGDLETYDLFISLGVNTKTRDWNDIYVKFGSGIDYLTFSKYFIPYFKIGLRKEFKKSRFFIEAFFIMNRDIDRTTLNSLPIFFQVNPFPIEYEYKGFQGFNVSIGRKF